MKPLLVVIAVLAWAPAYAHDLWIERTSAGFGLLYGHRPDSGHEHSHGGAAELIDYSPEIVTRFDCFLPDGTRTEAHIVTGSPVRIEGNCGALFAVVSKGFWSKTTSGTKNLSKKEAQGVLKSWRSIETVKRIEEWGAAFSRPLTRDFEITPLENPLALGPGSKIRVLVTLDGEPARGATVAYDGEPRGVTAQDGCVNLKIRHGGFQVIQASLAVPMVSEEADETVYTASLNFEIGGSE